MKLVRNCREKVLRIYLFVENEKMIKVDKKNLYKIFGE